MSETTKTREADAGPSACKRGLASLRDKWVERYDKAYDAYESASTEREEWEALAKCKVIEGFLEDLSHLSRRLANY